MKKNKFIRIFVAFAVLFSFIVIFCFQINYARAVDSWYNTDWIYRKKITIDHTKVQNTDQAYFPVLISATMVTLKDSANGGHVGQADGGDIVFTTTGGVKLDHEVEKYVPSTGELVAWVEVPSVFTSVDTDIYIYYGNALVADQWNVGGTWDDGGSNNFKGVWHLKDITTSTISDSTSYLNNANKRGANDPIEAVGQINTGQNFNYLSYALVTGANAGLKLTGSDGTFSAWVKPITKVNYDGIIGNNFASGWWFTLNAGKASFWSATGSYVYSGQTAVATDQWSHVLVTFDNATKLATFYLNGNPDGTAITHFTIGDGGNNYYIGNDGRDGIGYPFDGVIDELRVSNIKRSADWIKTEYNNQSSPATFTNFASSAEETAAVPDAPTDLIATYGNAQVGLSWTAPLNNGGAVITDYVIDYKLTTDVEWTTFADGESTNTYGDVIGLINGLFYDFRVSARNSAGQGDASATASATPKTIPGKPTITSAVAGDTQATINFNLLYDPTPTLWYNNSWTYRKKITIDKTKVPNTNQTNFPVLVSLTGLSNINTNGTDIRFTSSDGTTELAREIESYSAGTLVAWVKVPVLSTSVDTDIYMYYGNSSATEPAVDSTYGSQKVWDDGGDDNFKGVWHMGDASTMTAVDSTSNANNGSLSANPPTAIAGQMNGAAVFNGSNNYINLLNPASLQITGSQTIEMWVYPYDFSVRRNPYAKAYGGEGTITQETNGVASYYYGTAGGNASPYTSHLSGVMALNIWNHIVIVRNLTTMQMIWYINGVPVTVKAAPYAAAVASSLNSYIGWGYVGYYNGRIDETRISASARSTDWIATEYNNQRDPASFYAVASEEDVDNSGSNGGSEITNYAVTSDPEGITANGLSSPIIVAGLTNGTEYTFTVTATNVVGTGPSSDPSSSVTPATVPGQPTAVTPTYGDRQVSLFWSAPASNGGSAITDYVIEYKLTSDPDEPASWQISADPETATIVDTLVTGLVNGTSYDFRITAVNAVGSGSSSSPLVSSTPKTIPGEPTITSAVAGDTQVTVNFDLLSNPTTAPWYNNSWTYRKKITIDKTKVPNTNQTNFPVLVSLAGLSNINANATDVRFTSSDGTTELAREIESYSAGTLVAWVKIPVLSTSVDTDIYMYYGNSGATEPAVDSTYGSQKVWDDGGSNNFAGVWHMSEAGPTYVYDSTLNANTGTQLGTVVFGALGKIGYSTTYNGSQYFDVGSNESLSIGGETITQSAWIYPTANVAYGTIATKRSEYYFQRTDNQKIQTYHYGTIPPGYHASTDTVPLNQWSHVAYTYNGSNVTFYINGSLSGVISPRMGNISSVLWEKFMIGWDGQLGARYWIGGIDENRVSDVARSADWIATEYNNQSDPSSFYAVATEEDVANSATNGGSEITNYTVTSNPDSVVVSNSTSPIIVSGLTNGTEYTFTMTATNVVGQGPTSDASEAVTPAGVPGIPTEVIATPGNAQVDLSWTAPANNGAEITNYVIEYKLSVDETWTQFGHPVSPLTTISVVDLVNGSSYDFRVFAYNSAGTGASSDPPTSSTPRTVPGKPTITGVERGDGQVTVSFTPLSNITALDWYNNSWTYRKKITIDKTKVPNTNQTNFPVLVSLTGLSNINTNGTDIRFTSSDGTTELAREVESYADGTLVAWVKVPVLSTSVDTDIYMYYGNSGATEPDADSTYGAQKVWDDGGDNNFKGVWHLSDPTNPTDSTSNNNDGTNHGVTATLGKVDGSGSFNGISYADITSLTLNLSGSDFSASVWVKQNGTSYAVSQSHAVSPYASDWFIVSNVGGAQGIFWMRSVMLGNIATINDNNWHHLTMVWSVSAAKYIGYVDGASIGQSTAVTAYGGVGSVKIGARGDGTSPYYGGIDEIRVSSIARSADWIATEYNNQSAPASFYAVATEEDVANSATNGGSEITNYTVTSNPQAITQAGSTSPIIISGLTNGTEYTFTVKATNVAGDGPDSDASSSVTPAGVPGKATGVTAEAGNGQAVITFTAPLSNGGSAITGYTVSSNNGGTDINASSTDLSHTVTGLTNGATYTFTVVATNDVGDGLASDASAEITLPTEPTEPLNVATEVKSSSIKLTWSDPASTGGSAITDYVIEYQLTTGGTWATFDDGVSIDKFATVTGLSNGTSYDFRVSAKNIIGTSGASSVVSATPGEPAQVLIMGFSDLTNTSISTDIRITNEGVIEYEYQYTLCVTDAVDNLCGGGDDVFSASNAKLIDSGDDYDFTAISTVSTPGDYYFHIRVLYGSTSSSAFSSFTAVATFPDPPTGVSAVAGNEQATVSFTAPASNGGSEITNYTVTSNPGGLTETGLTTPIIITGLTNGTSYTFTMTATNIIGTGLSSSPPSDAVIPMTVPGIINSLSASAGNMQVGLFWSAPTSDGGSAITDYVIEYKLSSDSSWSIFADPISTVTSAIVTGLTNNLSYDFRVKAVNSVGQGPISSTSATSADDTPAPLGGGYVRVPPVVPTTPIDTEIEPVVILDTTPETTVPQANLPTASTSASNEVSATPTEASNIIVPEKQEQNSADSSEKNKKTAITWIIVTSVVALSSGFTVFILRRRRIVG
ncbi:MAG: DUF2341 domain-containing protein [Candidatus Staskawiczbacteria bacterium]|jgi:hypothetical protein